MDEGIFDCHDCSWPKARCDAKYPMRHRTVSYNKELSGPKRLQCPGWETRIDFATWPTLPLNPSAWLSLLSLPNVLESFLRFPDRLIRKEHSLSFLPESFSSLLDPSLVLGQRLWTAMESFSMSCCRGLLGVLFMGLPEDHCKDCRGTLSSWISGSGVCLFNMVSRALLCLAPGILHTSYASCPHTCSVHTCLVWEASLVSVPACSHLAHPTIHWDLATTELKFLISSLLTSP